MGTSKSHIASMVSMPLFMRVAQSTVILSPMFQVGCLSAWAGVTAARPSGVEVAEGAAAGREHDAADAVILLAPEALPDGGVLAVDRAEVASAGDHGATDEVPGHDERLLVGDGDGLARPPAPRIVGSRPAAPPVPASTMSTSSATAISSIGSQVAPTDSMASSRAASRSAAKTYRGRRSATCPARRAVFRPAASATISKRSGSWRVTSMVWRPMEPVEPRTAMRLGVMRPS